MRVVFVFRVVGLLFTLRNVVYKQVLRVDNLSIPASKTTVIAGESGSGKTTMLRLFNNLITPDSGEILYNGVSLGELDPIALRREVVMLPQNPVIFPGSVSENLTIGCEFAGKPSPSLQEQEEMLASVHLSKALDGKLENLSGGEKQRVALARLLLMNPAVLLLDEPSSALDEDTEKLVIERVVQYVHAAEKTLVMVTHSRRVAENYGEFVVTLKEGRIAKVERRSSGEQQDH